MSGEGVEMQEITLEKKVRVILLTAYSLCPCCQSDGPLGLGVVCRRITSSNSDPAGEGM